MPRLQVPLGRGGLFAAISSSSGLGDRCGASLRPRKAAVEFALAGKTAVMPTIVRTSDQPYRWKIGEAKLSRVANVERFMPKSFISKDGFGITAKARRYLAPLIPGKTIQHLKMVCLTTCA